MGSSKYLIINSEDIERVVFSQVQDTSQETVRKSIDGTKSIIEWVGPDPQFLDNIDIKDGPFSLDQILLIISSDFWLDKRDLH